ncbi:hypothetical protein [Parasphingorhabdus sp.]|uniref:hypothetical protein n=1 Tax=Parasphingorhabdus sp. TaxID=2709688 RepID=UPI00300117F3
MSQPAAEIDCQRHPAWMARLVLSGWLILASLGLAAQFDTQWGLGPGQNDEPSAVMAKADWAPYALTKTAHIIASARQQVPQDSGPDQTPQTPTLRNYPGFGAAYQSARPAAISGFVAEHILYRDGSRSISARAPPLHFSA